MAKAKKVIKEETPEVQAPKAEKTTKDSVTVIWRGNSRTYSLEIHGTKFMEYAREFASQYPDSTIV
jgi:hypothetical protein